MKLYQNTISENKVYVILRVANSFCKPIKLIPVKFQNISGSFCCVVFCGKGNDKYIILKKKTSFKCF